MRLDKLVLAAMAFGTGLVSVMGFGAGNIASISKLEGKNWRHGDIEDMLRKTRFLRNHKWTSLMIKRVYFGNWLRDYSQAMDIATLKNVPSDTIRLLVWILAFMSFGYATGEFEVTDERLGVYRPEEHIDNPRGYANGDDARRYDPRLRTAVLDVELQIDPQTGMKNYISNESGGWATSSDYVKKSLLRSIDYGRRYTSGDGGDAELFEALRCLGQALHCLEDFGAHSNYTELALIDMGYTTVFPHVGSRTELTVQGRSIYPLVTGTFGGVDFLHSVLGEADDHLNQSEIDELNNSLGYAASEGSQTMNMLFNVLQKIPETRDLCSEAKRLQSMYSQPSSSRSLDRGSDNGNGMGDFVQKLKPSIPDNLANIDIQNVISKIYPVLLFRDRVMLKVMTVVSKIPGLEKLVDSISEQVTLFVMSLIAPFVRPVIDAASKSLKFSSSTVVRLSEMNQFEVFNDPLCTDPTHSMLSKDHFSNILNEPAGLVASAVLRHIVPLVVHAWEHPSEDVNPILSQVCQVLHHPALRSSKSEIQNIMYGEVEKWIRSQPDNGRSIVSKLTADSVRTGRNHTGDRNPHLQNAAQYGQQSVGYVPQPVNAQFPPYSSHSVGAYPNAPSAGGFYQQFSRSGPPDTSHDESVDLASHGKVNDSPFNMITKRRTGLDGNFDSNLDDFNPPAHQYPPTAHAGSGEAASYYEAAARDQLRDSGSADYDHSHNSRSDSSYGKSQY